MRVKIKSDFMEVRVYEIEKKALPKVKAVLEKKDTLDIELKCKSCNKVEVRTISADRYKEFFSDEGEKVIKCSCGGNSSVSIKSKFTNEFALNGYTIRDGGSLGVKKDFTYLYIKAEENFFVKHEKEITAEGAKRISGKDFETVKGEIEKEQEAAAEGIGGIFNI
jgi:hypothetical protein